MDVVCMGVVKATVVAMGVAIVPRLLVMGDTLVTRLLLWGLPW